MLIFPVSITYAADQRQKIEYGIFQVWIHTFLIQFCISIRKTNFVNLPKTWRKTIVLEL